MQSGRKWSDAIRTVSFMEGPRHRLQHKAGELAQLILVHIEVLARVCEKSLQSLHRYLHIEASDLRRKAILTLRLKDSDVTWLYGPLHTATVEPVRPLKVSTAGERLGLDVGPRPSKPILKHRTLSEMLSITTPSSPVMEADTPDGAVDGMEGARPMLSQTKSDTNIFTTRPGMTIRRTSPTLPQGTFPGTGTGQAGQKSPNAPGTRTPIEGAPPSGKEKKHISFNTFVEQCIAVDDPTENQQNTFEDGDDSDDMLEMRSHRSSSSKSSRPSFSRHSSSSSTRSSNEPLTIAKIAPTMLKTQTYANSDQLPQMVYQPPPQYLSPERETVSVSPGMHSPVGPASWTSQSSTTSTGSAGSAGTAGTATGRKWDDDDGQPYDYFGGPDHSGKSSSSSSSSVSTAQGQSPAQNIPHRAPTVGQPPSQPKWRQANQGAQVGSSVESSVSASSSSSSTSLNNATSPSPPQPARSILKTRPASSEVPMEPESSSPPSSYFNYNPSAATGIGGMRGAQYLDHGPGGSPLVSPATASTAAASGNTSGSASGGEERGRSTSRGGTGTSQYDRSISRGTTSSTGSASSLSGSSGGGGAAGNGQGPMSPGTSRSPVGVHTARKEPAQSQVQGQAQGQRSQSQQQAQKPAQAQQAQTQDDGMEIDHDESPDRGASTPTPHSSPQVCWSF